MAAKRKRNRDHDDGPAEVLIPVSLLLDSGIPLEEISLLVGHKSTAVTELVYRKQMRPVLQTGAAAMDRIFGALPDLSHSDSHAEN